MKIRRAIQTFARARGLEIRRTDGRGLLPSLDAAWIVKTSRPLVFDIGANVGQTLRELKEQWPCSIVHCFEPDPNALLALRTVGEQYESVSINNIALGSSSGAATLHRHGESQMNSLLELGTEGWGHYEKDEQIAVRTVDDYCYEHQIEFIDLMKMDVQGYELHVLDGAEGMLKRNAIRAIQTELVFTDMYSGMAKPHELMRVMDEYGMRFVSLYKIHRTRAGAAEYADALFARI